MRLFLVTLLAFMVMLMGLLTPSAAAWWSERPDGYVNIEKGVCNSNSNGDTTVGLGVFIEKYDEDFIDYTGTKRDALSLRVTAVATTRDSIRYNCTYISWFQSVIVDEQVMGYLDLGDDDHVLVDMYLTVRFWGGGNGPHPSGLYDHLFIGSNGFIAFNAGSVDEDSLRARYYHRRSIPDPEGLNCFIAPFWGDLKPDQGGCIKYGHVILTNSKRLFFVKWESVPDENGNLNTFAVYIEEAPGEMEVYRQSKIWLVYENVHLNDNIVVGMEDQAGNRGLVINHDVVRTAMENNWALCLYQASEPTFIKTLTLRFRGDGNTYIDINTQPEWVRGFNVITEPHSYDGEARYTDALIDVLDVLLDAGEQVAEAAGVATSIAPIFGGVGLLLSGILLFSDLAQMVAEEYWEARDPVIQDLGREAYITLHGWDSSATIVSSDVVDAGMGVQVYWVLLDETGAHTLEVIAELTYRIYSSDGLMLLAEETIRTSVIVRLLGDAGETINTAMHLNRSDYMGYELKFYLGAEDTADVFDIGYWSDGDTIGIDMIPPADGIFYLYLLNSQGTVIAASEPDQAGETACIEITLDETDRYYVKVAWFAGDGLYSLYIELIEEYPPPSPPEIPVIII